MEDLFIGVDRRSQEQFEFLRAKEKWSLQHKERLLDWLLEVETWNRERELSLMQSLIELVADGVQHLPAVEAPETSPSVSSAPSPSPAGTQSAILPGDPYSSTPPTSQEDNDGEPAAGIPDH